MTDNIIYSINFEFTQNPTISVMDRGFLYGDSIYEVVRSYDTPHPFLLHHHYQRLVSSAKFLDFELPFDHKRLQSHVRDCFEKINKPNLYCRMIVTHGIDEHFDLSLPKVTKPVTVIIARPAKAIPEQMYTQGMHVSLVSVLRNSVRALNPRIKSGNYLNNILALKEAHGKGAQDALMLNEHGNLTEATTSNVFIVKNKTIYTPCLDCGILEGVTRGFLIDVLEKEKMPLKITKISKEELFNADEVFLSSTLKEIMPITKIDEHKVNDGQVGLITKDLMKRFEQHRKRWLETSC